MNKKRQVARSLPPGVSALEGAVVKVASENFDMLALQHARIFKAGNSLAIRIPSAIAKQCELEDGAAVEMAVDHGMIVVRKAPSRDLTALIERITPQNLHAPQFTDETGAERW